MSAAPVFQKKPARGGPFRLSPDPVVPSPWAGVGPAEEDEIDELPQTYGTQALYLVACDPEKLFAYWDIDWSGFEADEEPAIRICRADGTVVEFAAIDHSDTGHFAGIRADGGTYFGELGVQRGDGWRSIARSGLVTAPPGEVSTDAVARYVTIPPQMSFRALGEMLTPLAQTPQESPVEILARLQNEFIVQGPAMFEGMLPEQRSSLEPLFSPAPLVGGRDASSHAPETLPGAAPAEAWREALLKHLLHSETLAVAQARFGGSLTSPG
jgi:hypothetical protein